MKTEAEKKTKKPTGSEPEDEPKTLGFTGLLGIVLLMGALYNVPAILKVPHTTEEQMMLIIVITMAFGGAILLFFSTRR